RENEPITTRKITPAPAQGDVDPVIGYAQSRIQFDSQKYNSLLDRIDSARIELDTARAAFKYRYNVIKPPQVPRKPIKPNSARLRGGCPGARGERRGSSSTWWCLRTTKKRASPTPCAASRRSIIRRASSGCW